MSILLIISNLLIPVSMVIFATGFFPYKPLLPGLAEYENLGYGAPPAAPFNRLVFMVVDALRSDFVYSNGSGFHFTQSLIRNGTAMPFTANARSPTVTMPRIKSMTTGSIPSFVDLILNIDEADTSSSLASQDTWLAQLKISEKGKLLMYGDDTWLKLFPDTFDRHDGTTSFFVSDFTQVDKNVTRHVAPELENSDWSLMVLHYLGLDHIGHKAGPKSFHMVPKQREMDNVVERIYRAMESNTHLDSTLLIVCGDHGMNDAGNHGASSPGETSPALVFISPKLRAVSSKQWAPAQPVHEYDYFSTVEQSDIAPTIAALLGFPVPKNNLGVFIPDFFPLWSSSSDMVQIVMRNARQMLGIVTAAFGAKEVFDADTPSNSDACTLEGTSIMALGCKWRQISRQASSVASTAKMDQVWLSDAMNWLRETQDLMSNMASNYDMVRLNAGQWMALAAVMMNMMVLRFQGTWQDGSWLPVLTLSVSYGAMMFASSYVEEEQHFWYWSTTLALACMGLRAIRGTRRLSAATRYLLALGALRLARGWNQTGQKFAGEPDIVKSYLLPHPRLLWALVVATYAVISFQLTRQLKGLPPLVATLLASASVLAAFAFKLAFTAADSPELVAGFARDVNEAIEGPSLLRRARLVFAFIVGLLAYAVWRAIQGGRYATYSPRLVHQVVALLAVTQSRVTNVPLLLLATIIYHCLESDEGLDAGHMSALSVMLQHVFFFAFGGSNAISSVDLASAYNGIASFNVVAVGVLTFIGNWAGPIFWTLATANMLLQHGNGGNGSLKTILARHLGLVTLFATTSMAAVMAASMALRTHLFIWTVFSPKYLYAMAWGMGQHLVVDLCFGSLVFLLGWRRQ
ncbi:hypothetical protein CDD81_7142 [Ophiocordyceps australis]|uniref:GPI ethanolamine phosphate transferase 2 n=1 Tax=Ophiocordyceps australis TaxID=1399860 RepID=A0A2C5Y450_9HYPO|nr:hypothetical protein CDD81_7142 [Ophiocordyceps australis]